MLGVSVNERLFFSAPVANMESTPPRGAIAYLAQGVRHSTYGRDSLALLRRSLSLLYQNYAAADAADTILFHRDDSDFPPAARDSVLRVHPRRRLRFERIPEADWSLPPALLHKNRSSWYADEAAGGGPHAFRSQRLRQLLGPRSRDLTGDRERRLMGPQGRKHVYRMHHCEPLSAVL